MDLLLDTHVALWWLDDPSKISAKAHEAIADLKNSVYLSAVVAWEIAIESNLGKLTAPDDLLEAMAQNYFDPLPIAVADGLAVGTLPLLHRDPFDRMLVAQAIERNWTIVTRDPLVQQYDVQCLMA